MRADVLSLGAVCPIGLDALQVSRCLRAGLKPVRTTRFVDAFDDALGAVFTPHLGEDVIGEERLVMLAAPALRSALPALGGGVPPAPRPVPLVLGVDASFAEGRGLFEALAEALRGAEAEGSIDWTASRIVGGGHAGFGVALEAGLSLLGDGAPEVIVGAVDSHCDPFRLRQLDEAFAIHSRRAQEGFVPSEGAFFARLGRPGGGAPTGRPAPRPLARILEARSGLEPTVPAGEVNLAATATSLVRSLEERCTAPVRWWLTDANGEPHRAREVSFVWTRSAPMLDASTEHLPLGRLLGDLGAAAMGLGVVHACRLLCEAHDTTATALVSGHGEGGERSVVLLGAPPPR